MKTPRIVIAGTHSGCGKTTVSRGLMQALRRNGLVVQPFKVGPDFIDPSHHTAICGRVSRNLDPFMMGEDGVVSTFLAASAGADISVIEGVMGMYDGIDGTARASTAHVMRILGCPALLVIDVSGMSRSAHAVISGFRCYEPGINIAGVIFNRVGSSRHETIIRDGLSARAFGFIPRTPGLAVDSRHLGLKMAFEIGESALPGSIVLEHCDVEGILCIAESAPRIPGRRSCARGLPATVTIAIAHDEAFCFYYRDNLEALETAGASLVYFSPLHDPLPEADGYYFGGGYPEIHAAALGCAPATQGLKAVAEEGRPVFGECGGLLYLCNSLGADEKEHRMAGILTADAQMTGGIRALGYTEGRWTGGPGMAAPGHPILGHEFHYSRIDPDRDSRFAITLSRGTGIADGKDGLFSGETVGSYTHSYFSAAFAGSFVAAARLQKRR